MTMQHLMRTYASLPLSFSHGEGVWLHSTEGQSYLDCVAGVAVCALGHGHPKLAEAIADQARRLLHVSNLFTIPEQIELGDKLCELSGMDRLFFGNSGAEANEACIKLSRLYGHSKGITSPKVIVTEGSFHGRTMATLSATGNTKVQEGFAPLVEGFLRVPYNDLTAIEKILAENSDVVAIHVEPVQGEGGVNIPDADYLPGIRAICDQHDLLMMLDEVQTGIGRTGQWFGFQHYDIQPDVMALAKGLGGGMPIGACLARGKAAELFAPGSHGSTFGGNPLVSSAAKTVVEVIETENLLDNVNRQNQRLKEGFSKALEGVDGVVEIRGQGLLFAIELDRPCGDLVKQGIEQGILINVTNTSVVRLIPPLILSDSEADTVVEKVSDLIKAFL